MKKTILGMCMVITIFGTLQVGQINNDELSVGSSNNNSTQTREYIANA